MSEAKTDKPRVPAVEGWFTMGAAPALLGTRCLGCSTIFFPREMVACRNPACRSTRFEEVPLSRRGKLWSYTTNHYKPPEPAISPDPFVPYTVAAVELTEERMVVLGQLADGVDPASIEVGQEMELTLATLYEDDENEYIVWKWKPVAP